LLDKVAVAQFDVAEIRFAAFNHFPERNYFFG
jgi:hypothetical protein